MEYYSGIRRNEVLTHPATWMNFENTVLRSLPQKTTYVWFLLYEISRIGKSIETESRLVLSRDGE